MRSRLIGQVFALILILSIFTNLSFANELSVPRNSDQSRTSSAIVWTGMWTVLGGTMGWAVHWGIGVSKLDPEQDGELIDHNSKLGTYIGVGALIGAVIGLATIPKLSSNGLINFSKKEKLRLNFPRFQHDAHRKIIKIPIFELSH